LLCLIVSLSTNDVVEKHQQVPVIPWFFTEVAFIFFTSKNCGNFTGVVVGCAIKVAANSVTIIIKRFLFIVFLL
jgi:hypothetical protein